MTVVTVPDFKKINLLLGSQDQYIYMTRKKLIAFSETVDSKIQVLLIANTFLFYSEASFRRCSSK